LVYGSPSSAHGTKTFRILCYGDSNSIGYIGEGKNISPYGQALAAALRVAGVSCEVTCCGLCGFTSEELVDRINAPYIQPKTGPSSKGLAHVLKDAAPFDLVIIMVGTNDIGRFMDPRMTLAFTTRLHSACHALGIKTINIVPPTVGCNFKLNEFQTQMRESRTRLAEITNAWAAGNPHVLLSLDCETLVPKNIAQLWEWDDIHFSIHGSQQLAKNLASQLIVTLGHLTQCNTQPVAISRQPVSQEPSQIFLDPVRWLNVRQPSPQRVVAYA
jgi:lysophospholipase L1-like esterase